jgi:hypothetical protein
MLGNDEEVGLMGSKRVLKENWIAPARGSGVHPLMIYKQSLAIQIKWWKIYDSCTQPK